MIELIIVLLAGSLENLENELNAEAPYRAELKEYVLTHNLTDYPFREAIYDSATDRHESMDTVELYKLEQVVKEHMLACRAAGGLVDVYGDC